VLTAIGRILFNAPCGDFNCGLRGFDREAIRKLRLEAPGMEFAFEMLIHASRAGLTIDEVPIVYHPRRGESKLSTFADGWRTLSELMLLLEAVDKPLLRTASMLGVASGHGRFTRHLVKALGAERFTVSDIVADAVDFSQQTFGVKGFASASVPEQVRWPQQYELVFVLSLFSHLPRSTWTRWLQVLRDAVAPGGLLVFSTHGVKAAEFDSVKLDDDGFFFAPSSESNAIDANEYGTAFTSERFVLDRIAETWGSDALRHRSLVHFWNHQDAYVLQRR